MPSEHAAFNSVNGKRKILIVDDENINRDILGAILEDGYETLFAADGEEALEKIRENRDTLSLIILDLIMPKLSGTEVLKTVKSDPELARIPVIVASADLAQEIDCLNLGASDFIQKPYPDSGVIRARVLRTIELSEDRQIIKSTERDPLTGLYNYEYFLSYAEKLDVFHKDMDMDAILIDINRFSILNERHGRAYADEVLVRLAEKARETVHEGGGIVCRRDADTFLIYCPHREDYKIIIENASAALEDSSVSGRKVRLRMGVYSRVDKSVGLEQRFDRAKTAADSVRNSYARNIGIYDDQLRKTDLYSEQLVEDFQTALDEHQFTVYFQPKFDIRPETPLLGGAEALVRWNHPELGFISPGVFIPLFEENGLVQALDEYVWREAARQIRAWKDKFGFSVPVSANASRVDMYDPAMIYNLQGIMKDYDLAPSDLNLEVTESAYSEDSEQIIDMVKKVRLIGHKIEMDDFGTGYSSLNMLSEMPIDALKLDMKFIRNAFSGEKDTHMIEVIINIANHLHVPVIAEGVETQEQLEFLKTVGCEYVQGYYFSPPVPAEKFEAFLEERAKAEIAGKEKKTEASIQPGEAANTGRLSRKYNIPLKKANILFVVLAFIFAAVMLIVDTMVNQGYAGMESANERYILASESSAMLESGSDYLTGNVRSFVVTGDIQYLKNYFEEAEVTRSRDRAVANMETLFDSTASSAYVYLSSALALSNELMGLEYHAMKLTLGTGEYDPGDIPDVIRNIELPFEEQALSTEEKGRLAAELVYGDEYENYKTRIFENTALCTSEVIEESSAVRLQASRRMNTLLLIQTVLTILFLLIILVNVIFIVYWIRNPLTRMVKLMRAKKAVTPEGASELRFVSQTYNEIYEENRIAHNRLSYSAAHDALTGLYNRSAYDLMRQDIEVGNNALLLIDVDKFKTVNDTYGHNVGDLVLKRVGELLQESFRQDDLVFRLGGDEFVVIMNHVDSSRSDELINLIEQMNVQLQQSQGDIPPVSLSVGIAFTDRKNPGGDIFKDADTALYRVKNAGRRGCEVY